MPSEYNGKKTYRNRSKIQKNIVGRGNMESSSTHIHELLLFWLGIIHVPHYKTVAGKTS